MNIFSPDKLCCQINTDNFHARRKLGVIPSAARKLLFGYGFGVRLDSYASCLHKPTLPTILFPGRKTEFDAGNLSQFHFAGTPSNAWPQV
jgi:hypothetical protein